VDRKERMDAEIKKVIDGRTKEFREKLAKLAYEKIKAQLVPEKEPLKGYPHNESIEEESDSKEFQQEIDMIANMIKKGEHERLAKMIKRTAALSKGGGWNLVQKPSKRQKDQYNKMVRDHKKKHRALYASYNEEVTISLDESVLTEKLRLRSPSKTTTIDIDYIGSSSDINQSQREYNIKIKKTGRQMADITGKKGDIVKFLQGDAYAMDDEDIKDLFPELLEGMRELESMFGLRATDWRKLVKKHKRDIDAFQKGRKDLPKNVEDELLAWAMDNGEVQSKDDAEDFIDIILNA
jgi:Txe/YoeB family toxin of Txe-Axe toxin-antitoxin module